MQPLFSMARIFFMDSIFFGMFTGMHVAVLHAEHIRTDEKVTMT
jgi:hypothetical protein